MKIHTKHLALCEKGGKFNKTLNTICKLQEDLIEPQEKSNVFVSLIMCFYIKNVLYFQNCTASRLYEISARLFSLFKMRSSLYSKMIISHAARDVSAEVFPKLMVALGQHHR